MSPFVTTVTSVTLIVTAYLYILQIIRRFCDSVTIKIRKLAKGTQMKKRCFSWPTLCSVGKSFTKTFTLHRENFHAASGKLSRSIGKSFTLHREKFHTALGKLSRSIGKALPMKCQCYRLSVSAAAKSYTFEQKQHKKRAI